jgi:magnesium transporter
MTIQGLREINTNNFSWIDLINPDSLTLEKLKRRFSFHSLDIKDCLPPLQRAKLEVRSHYLFLILLFPVYNRQTKEITSSEVDFFISKNLLVTVHSGNLLPLNDFFHKCQTSPHFQKKYLMGNPAIIIYEILNRLLQACFPMLIHMNEDSERVEKGIFNDNKKRTILETSIIKRNIVMFRKTMQTHKNVIQKLISAGQPFFSTAKLNIYFRNLIDHTKEIWDILQAQKDTIDSLYETHISLQNWRVNEIMKALTIFAVIVFPLNLFAAIFGMNTHHTPIIGWAYDFWIISGLMGLGVIAMVWFFRHKKWI